MARLTAYMADGLAGEFWLGHLSTRVDRRGHAGRDPRSFTQLQKIRKRTLQTSQDSFHFQL